MKIIKLLKNINNLLVISIIDKIGVFNNFKTDAHCRQFGHIKT